MAKIERTFMIVPAPIPEDQLALRESVEVAHATLEWKGFMLHEVRPAVEEDGTEIRWSLPDGREGPCEQREYRKTIDYSREERRAAARAGQELKPNQFKGILPAGWQVLAPDDPRLQDPTPPASGQ